MQVLGILIELRGEGAANAGIYRHTCRSRASSIFVLHAPYKVTRNFIWRMKYKNATSSRAASMSIDASIRSSFASELDENAQYLH